MPLAPSVPSAGGVAVVIVLAAGAGKRMRSRRPKVLHELAGRPLVWHALTAAAGLAPGRLVAVLGHGREQVTEFLGSAADLPPVVVAIQDRQLGTGHACGCALEVTGPVDGTVLVTYGDVPLLRTETLAALAQTHAATGNAVTVLTAAVDDPTGYGRIIRDDAGGLVGIVEQKDATAEQLMVREVNSGVYAFDGSVLSAALGRLSTENASGERYLTDVVGIARAAGRRVGTVMADDPVETEGVNDRVQLADLARVLNARLIRRAQLAGVTVHDPATTWLHADVVVGPDTELLPGTSLQAGTVVGSGCSIGPDTTLIACTVGDDASVVRSHGQGAAIGDRAQVGPFSFLRQGAALAPDSKAGAFVEIKNSRIGAGSKVPHLSYVGDATIGIDSNIGAGTIVANYDGEHKHATVVGDHSFVGSNSTLVAPVAVHDGAFVAAGSTITDDVAPGDLAVARGRQHTSPGWVGRRRPDSAAAAAAARAETVRPAHPGPTDPADAVDGPGAPAARNGAPAAQSAPAAAAAPAAPPHPEGGQA